MRPGAGYRSLTSQHLANDLNVFPGSGQWLREGLPVPALDHLGAGQPQSQHQPAIRQVIHGQGVHGRRSRSPSRYLHDRRSQLDARGVSSVPGQGAERVRTPRLGGEDDVEAELLRFEDLLQRVFRRLRLPVPEL
jgi:hypothetical protein